MFRIRRIYDCRRKMDIEALTQVRQILKTQIPMLAEKELDSLPKKLRNPLKYKFRPIVMIAENGKGSILALAVMLHEPELSFMFLDFLSAAPGITGRGLGGILYSAVREEAAFLKCIGIFMECLPDTAELSPDPLKRKQNIARLKFYERYGARPVIGTKYETPLSPDDTDPPFLVFDPLNQTELPLSARVRPIVRAVLERKYADLCPPAYIDMVVASFRDGPIRLRDYRYLKDRTEHTGFPAIPESKQARVFLNPDHKLHHVHERGYVESPIRIASILKSLDATGIFLHAETMEFPEKYLRMIHDRKYLRYMERLFQTLDDNPVYPYVFPIRNRSREPVSLPLRAGYYCIDTFTPLTKTAYKAALQAVNCALSAAVMTRDGGHLSYALVRPPGHHAERDVFGGFCYFNSTAAAAQLLSGSGKVAILDIDYHHGNGQQQIFYNRADVLTISIHGHPSFAYPYFSGFANEKGESEGRGYNLNIPLDEHISPEQYTAALQKALDRIERFRPDFLVVALGLDTAHGDPTGTWDLRRQNFETNGRLIGQLDLPTVVVQEGGYDNRVIGPNAAAFFKGLWSEYYYIKG
ncbi:MAG: histone deacetylase family protein [Spirochaetales bacterium]|nr:histone deacetylase family protein [Spirochaetales bacterium]